MKGRVPGGGGRGAPAAEAEFAILRKSVLSALTQVASDHPELQSFGLTVFGSPKQLEQLTAVFRSISEETAKGGQGDFTSGGENTSSSALRDGKEVE